MSVIGRIDGNRIIVPSEGVRTTQILFDLYENFNKEVQS